jgi:hypothetical protein
MREKQLVAFRLAPKRDTSKGKGKEVASGEATLGDGWIASKCSDFNILSLVKKCILQLGEVIQW